MEKDLSIHANGVGAPLNGQAYISKSAETLPLYFTYKIGLGQAISCVSAKISDGNFYNFREKFTDPYIFNNVGER